VISASLPPPTPGRLAERHRIDWSRCPPSPSERRSRRYACKRSSLRTRNPHPTKYYATRQTLRPAPVISTRSPAILPNACTTRRRASTCSEDSSRTDEPLPSAQPESSPAGWFVLEGQSSSSNDRSIPLCAERRSRHESPRAHRTARRQGDVGPSRIMSNMGSSARCLGCSAGEWTSCKPQRRRGDRGGADEESARPSQLRICRREIVIAPPQKQKNEVRRLAPPFPAVRGRSNVTSPVPCRFSRTINDPDLIGAFFPFPPLFEGVPRPRSGASLPERARRGIVASRPAPPRPSYLRLPGCAPRCLFRSLRAGTPSVSFDELSVSR